MRIFRLPVLSGCLTIGIKALYVSLCENSIFISNSLQNITVHQHSFKAIKDPGKSGDNIVPDDNTVFELIWWGFFMYYNTHHSQNNQSWSHNVMVENFCLHLHPPMKVSTKLRQTTTEKTSGTNHGVCSAQ